MVELKCGCQVTDEGKFEVGTRCANCKECNFVSKLHPFGPGRLN